MNGYCIPACAAISLMCLTGCAGDERPAPTAPSIQSGSPDESLKVSAPVPLSPPDNTVIEPTSSLILRVRNSEGSYATVTPAYEVELWNPLGAFTLRSSFLSSSGPTSDFKIIAPVETGVALQWRARATLEGHFGPWSDQRSVWVNRTAQVRGLGSSIERGEELHLSMQVLQQGGTSPCVDAVSWASDPSDVAIVSQDGILIANRLGSGAVTGRCGPSVDTKVFTVVETWHSSILFKSCYLALGTGRSCWNTGMAEGASGTLRLEVTGAGAETVGELSLPSIGAIPFWGAISSDKQLTGNGRKVTCGENRTIVVSLEVVADRLDLRIREVVGLGCNPDGPFTSEWQVVADLDRLSR